MNRIILPTILAALSSVAFAQIPYQLNYQGRVSVGTPPVNFTGTGQFKFALVKPEFLLSRRAYCVPTATNGVLVSAFVYEPGLHYTSPPAVTITGDGTGATAFATVAGGQVTGITVINGGTGYNFFSLVIAPPPEIYQFSTSWSNDLTSASGSEPTAAVALPVSNGLYSLALGNTALANMAMLPGNQFENRPDERLRVWFNDGTHGFQLLTPDQRLLAAPYAMSAGIASTVPDGAITAEKIADGSIVSFKLADGAVSSSKLAAGAAATNLNAGGNQDVALRNGAFGGQLSVGNHALGSAIFNFGQGSFGRSNTVAGVGSLAVGRGLSAQGEGVLACGVYNQGGSIFSVGNGVMGAPSNVFQVNFSSVVVNTELVASDNLTVGGNISYVGTLTDVSDERLKDLGESFDAGLEEINRIRPLHYRFRKNNPLGAPSDPVHVGVSAQALRAALPEAVVERTDGYLAVNQDPVIWALVNAVKELKAENDSLRSRLETIEQKLK